MLRQTPLGFRALALLLALAAGHPAMADDGWNPFEARDRERARARARLRGDDARAHDFLVCYLWLVRYCGDFLSRDYFIPVLGRLYGKRGYNFYGCWLLLYSFFQICDDEYPRVWHLFRSGGGARAFFCALYAGRLCGDKVGIASAEELA